MSSTSSQSDSQTDSDHQQRQPARRVFAHEFHDATYMFKEDDDDDRAPKFALLPTGERANRIAIVGTLTETENIGNKSDYWQARIVDPTGTNFAYAGRYQPKAMQELDAIEVPTYVAVIGKPKTYETDEGEVRTSLTIEEISVVDGVTRDRWVLETIQHTRERIDAFTSDDPPTDAVQANEQYGTDLTGYIECADQALDDLETKLREETEN